MTENITYPHTRVVITLKSKGSECDGQKKIPLRAVKFEASEENRIAEVSEENMPIMEFTNYAYEKENNAQK